MVEFQRFRIDLSGAVDSAIAKKLSDPPGYSQTAGKEIDATASVKKGQQTSAVASVARRQAALFAFAHSPLKQAAMMCFMMYMAGSQLHFFSILTTINGVYSPLNAILKSGQAFQRDSEGKLNVAGPRMIFCLIHGASLAFAVYRVHLMGLLPTHLSDWVAGIQAPVPMERTVAGLFQRP